jgi:saccharopine dehydrogenase (NAD+, L-lysine-forming)
MSGSIERVAVIGLGKVGATVGVLLGRTGFTVLGVDGRAIPDLPFESRKADVSDPATVGKLLEGQHAVVSCLPYHLNLGIAKVAHERGIHYFDLTEDVPSTQAILAMAKDSKTVLAPQCGLAPGFIGIVGAALAADFDKIRSIELRVGALPEHPSGMLGYAFNWSSEGVVNEYLNDCEVIREGRRMTVPSLGQLETIVINGMRLEAFTTSGGLGTMCETFDGRVQELNYKTLRYPGHCDLMRFFFHELHLRDDRKLAGEILVNAKPPVDDDVVFVHAAVEGWQDKLLKREEYVEAFYPIDIDGQIVKAISWTTAASVCAVVEMVADEVLPRKGFIRQESIPFDRFLETRNGGLYIG